MKSKLSSISFKSIKRLYQYSKTYRLRIFLLAFIKVVLAVMNVSVALLSKEMIDYATTSLLEEAVKYGIITGIVFLGQVLIGLVLTIITTQYTQQMRNDIELEITKTVYHKSWIAINQYPVGDLITRISNDSAGIVSIWLSTFPNILSLFVNLVIAFIALSIYDITLAFVAFFIGPIAVIFSWIVGRKLKALTHKVQRAESTFNSYLNESLHNMIILKSFNYISANVSQLSAMQNNRKDAVIERTKLNAFAGVIMSFGYRLGFFGALALGAYRLFLDAITFGTFTAFLQLVSQVQGPMEGLVRSVPSILSTLASIERIEELEEAENEAVVSKSALPNDYHHTFSKLSIKDVSFSYIADKLILKDFSLDLTKGEKIAILGHSGEGKTTFLRLLLNLITKNSGEIKAHFSDGQVLDIDTKTRGLFSYVPQNNVLFSGSIRDNLTMHHSFADKEIERAVKASCSKEFIQKMPEGLDALIGDRSQGLSSGQIQRICIARALLHNTPILILDEATSSLDMQTEYEMVNNLVTMYPNKTVISITHRTAILDICDYIYQLKDGKLHQVSRSQING